VNKDATHSNMVVCPGWLPLPNCLCTQKSTAVDQPSRLPHKELICILIHTKEILNRNKSLTQVCALDGCYSLLLNKGADEQPANHTKGKLPAY